MGRTLTDLKNVLIIDRLLKTRKGRKASNNSSSGCSTLIAFAIIVGLCAYSFQWCHSKISYWDEIYVRNWVKTYKNQDFSVKSKDDIDIVNFKDEDKFIISIPIFNKIDGREKTIDLKLPVYRITVNTNSKTNLDDVETVLSYEQPTINQGFHYIRPQDAILRDSKQFNDIVENEKIKYMKSNPDDRRNWTFKKPN